MIIDDEYSQYEMFRIINKAGVDARAGFEKEKADGAEKASRLEFWKEQFSLEDGKEVLTEESVYNAEYARIMAQCWEQE